MINQRELLPTKTFESDYPYVPQMRVGPELFRRFPDMRCRGGSGGVNRTPNKDVVQAMQDTKAAVRDAQEPVRGQENRPSGTGGNLTKAQAEAAVERGRRQ